MNIIVSNIKWATNAKKAKLPKTFKVNVLDLVGDKAISYLLSELITEKTGFRNDGFSWDLVKKERYAVTELYTRFRSAKDLVSVHTFDTKNEATKYAKKRIEAVQMKARRTYGKKHCGSLFDHHACKRFPSYEFVNLDGDLTELIITKVK